MAEQEQSTEPSALDKVNSARLVSEVRNRLKTALDPFVFDVNDEHTHEQIKKTIEGFAERMQGTGLLKDYTVGKPQLVYHGWREIYPNVGKRILAWIGSRVFRLSYDRQQRWYHTVFPFKIEYRPAFNSDALTRREDGTWVVHLEFDEYADAAPHVDVGYMAQLRLPYTTTNLDFFIRPIQPVEYIKVNLAVAPEGVQLGE